MRAAPRRDRRPGPDNTIFPLKADHHDFPTTLDATNDAAVRLGCRTRRCRRRPLVRSDSLAGARLASGEAREPRRFLRWHGPRARLAEGKRLEDRAGRAARADRGRMV